MQKINSEADLKNAILQLESQQTMEGKMLKDQFNLAYESIKPINIIKNTFKEASASIDLKDNILNTSVGLSAGFLSKTLFVGFSRSPIKRLLGTAIMFGITNVVTKHPEGIKLLGRVLLNAMRRNPESRGQRNPQQ